jgi:YtcA family
MEQFRFMEERLKMGIEPSGRNQWRRMSFCELGALSLTAALPLVGCSHSPEYSIFGSFFPAWIFCSLGGLFLMAGARAVIARTAIAEHLAAPVLFYFSAAVFLTCMLWLLFYS